jgi:hypothetical protein
MVLLGWLINVCAIVGGDEYRMPIENIKCGDCIDQIAVDHGLLPETIWDHPDNSELKSLRKDRNILYAGDVLFIPDKALKVETVAAGSKYKFKRKAVPAKFKLQLKKNATPRANSSYTLHIDNDTFEGKTDADGWIEQSIPPRAEKGKLILTDSNETYVLNLGHLDPLDQVEGVQQRLKNLGFYGGDIDGEEGVMTRTAIQFFQKDRGMTVGGVIDDELKNSLQDGHGS